LFSFLQAAKLQKNGEKPALFTTFFVSSRFFLLHHVIFPEI